MLKPIHELAKTEEAKAASHHEAPGCKCAFAHAGTASM